MSKGTVTVTWGKFPTRLVVAMTSLSLVTWFDIWSKLEWFGQLVMMSAIVLLVFQPAVIVKSGKVKVENEVEKENDEDGFN